MFDLAERPLLVTEHQASIYRCADCRGETKAAFPDGVVSPTQYGERIKAAAIYLNVQQLIPEDRTAQALSDLFGAPLICPASIVAWVGKKAQELRQVYEFIGERVAEAKVRHLDETGFRIAGKLQWLHTTSSLAFTFYRADEKRGAIPEDLQGGVVVHDHFLPYRRLDAVDHAFCNAHILRELKSLIEFDHEPWAELMRDMLLAANLAVDKAREAGARALAPDELEAFVERYWAAVRLGLAFHRELPKLEAKANAARAHQAPPRPQSAPKAENLPNRNPALPHRFRRALHQQPGRTGPEDDEGQNENLGLVSNPRRRSNLRPPQIRRLDREKTRLQHPPNPHRKPSSDHPRLRRIADGLGVTFRDGP